MKFEIDTPKQCSDCVFCSELCYCLLMYGEPTEVFEDNKRSSFCPFDNKASREKMAKGVSIIDDAGGR